MQGFVISFDDMANDDASVELDGNAGTRRLFGRTDNCQA
jgi:hypothetical protein